MEWLLEPPRSAAAAALTSTATSSSLLDSGKSSQSLCLSYFTLTLTDKQAKSFSPCIPCGPFFLLYYPDVTCAPTMTTPLEIPPLLPCFSRTTLLSRRSFSRRSRKFSVTAASRPMKTSRVLKFTTSTSPRPWLLPLVPLRSKLQALG